MMFAGLDFVMNKLCSEDPTVALEGIREDAKEQVYNTLNNQNSFIPDKLLIFIGCSRSPVRVALVFAVFLSS